MVCKKCGNEISEGAKFCRYCGLSLETPNEEAASETSAAAPKEEAPKREAVTEAPAAALAGTMPAAPEGKKSHKKLIIIIVAVVLAVAAAAAGIGVYLVTSSPQYKYDKALERAKQHFEDEEYEDALSYYNEALVWMEDSREAQKGILKTYLKLAETYYTEGRYQESVEYYDLVLKESQNENARTGRTQSYLALGKQKYEGGEYKAAYDAFQKVLEEDAYNEEALSRLPDVNIALGKDCYEAGKYDEAFNYYEAARAQDESREEIYRGESDIYLQRGDVKQAVALLEQGLMLTSAEKLSERKQYIIDNSVVSSADEYYYSGNYSYHREYDTEGNTIKEQYYRGSNEQSRVLSGEWEYDKDGMLVRSISYNEQGNVTYQKDENTEASYYNNGIARYQITREQAVYYDESGNLVLTEKYTRDDKGNVVHAEGVGGQGDTYYTVDSAYNAGGNLERIVATVREGIDWWGEEGSMTFYPTTWFWSAEGLEDYTESNGMITLEETYDGNNHLTRWWVTYADGTEYGNEYTYDERGNRLREVYYSMDGTSTESRYAYDADGNQTEYTAYDNTGRMTYEEQYSYISKDLIEYHAWNSYYNQDGSVSSSGEEQYIYDENNNLLHIIGTSYSEYNGESYWEEEYTYDNMGNRTSDIYYNDSNGYGSERYSTYDDKGNCTSEAYYSQGEFYYKYEYAYDDDGNRISMREENRNGSHSERYQYDAFGSRIERYRDSEFVEMCVYEYQFVG